MDNEINNIFEENKGQKTYQSDAKMQDDDPLSTSQISRAHKFNIKRFSAALIHEPIQEPGKSTMKSPPKTLSRISTNKNKAAT